MELAESSETPYLPASMPSVAQRCERRTSWALRLPSQKESYLSLSLRLSASFLASPVWGLAAERHPMAYDSGSMIGCTQHLLSVDDLLQSFRTLTVELVIEHSAPQCGTQARTDETGQVC